MTIIDLPTYRFREFLITPSHAVAHAAFKVEAILGYEEDEATGEYTKPHEVEFYLECLIKWDSCCHFTFGEGDGYLHLCGVYSLFDHAVLIQHLYETAFELMGEGPEDGQEWPCLILA